MHSRELRDQCATVVLLHRSFSQTCTAAQPVCARAQPWTGLDLLQKRYAHGLPQRVIRPRPTVSCMRCVIALDDRDQTPEREVDLFARRKRAQIAARWVTCAQPRVEQCIQARQCSVRTRTRAAKQLAK